MGLTTYIIIGIIGLAALYAIVIMIFQIVRALNRKIHDIPEEEKPLDESED